MSDNEMKLPNGATCADCAHLKRCAALFGAKPENTECDFYPIRFSKKKPVEGGGERL